MMKRICKFKYKLIMLLLILSILLGEFAVRPMSVKAIDLVTYTYWDLWYSIAGAQKASMSAKEGPFDGYDVAELKDRAKVQFDNFKIWLQRAYVPVGITVDMLVNQADEMIANAKTTGLEMSQELWDAFRQYFDDVANEKPLPSNTFTDFEVFKSFVCTNFGLPEAAWSVILGTNAGSRIKDHYQRPMAIFTSIDAYSISHIYFVIQTGCNSGWSIENNAITCKCDTTSSHLGLYSIENVRNVKYNCDMRWYNKIGTSGWTLRAFNDSLVNVNIATEYSPYIDYTVSQGCPVEVPETIPWRVYPKEETDDDTKIIPFPVEVPDEGTTEVPGEETTEKPNPDEDPDNDNDEENDPFPGIFPWFPNVPNSNPDENPDIPPWENPDSDSDPESGLSPDPDPNPDPDPDPPEPEPDPDPPGKVENYLNKLKTKFPFCIPFDMVALFKNLKKTQKAPKWTFSYTFRLSKNNSYTWKIVVDMADYDKYIQIFREGFFVLFLVGLFFVTRKLISWQID